MLRLSSIDMDALLTALDGPEEGDIQWWIDPVSGRIDMSDDDFDDENRSEDLAERGWIAVTPVGSHAGYRDMEDFIGTLNAVRARAALLDAIGQRRPFRRFKETLFTFPEIQDQWYAFHDDRMREHAIRWLVATGLIAETEAGRPGDVA